MGYERWEDAASMEEVEHILNMDLQRYDKWIDDWNKRAEKAFIGAFQTIRNREINVYTDPEDDGEVTRSYFHLQQTKKATPAADQLLLEPEPELTVEDKSESEKESGKENGKESSSAEPDDDSSTDDGKDEGGSDDDKDRKRSSKSSRLPPSKKAKLEDPNGGSDKFDFDDGKKFEMGQKAHEMGDEDFMFDTEPPIKRSMGGYRAPAANQTMLNSLCESNTVLPIW
ncbi:hypothetical protein M7I_1719 [Glarea lozoyensis 74030]|uniref:Uncharacterized protein n=1 Tax=Glarea lozoyensis (strain ATCC 74030 / MF5533) TaxID=1104152 RepID=H0EGY8_GLAL7|nr:hypothetical protein M7I_1719 [Glarea lozoyensis 74030]